ncbi:hypothetical protein CYMTET_48804 [Cymbomonas tetramitiformis]|uniref:Protein kinase domain-containing protein n=1 Tax=Cymbomonas tetramitiformis TaxID=36881 RepID=A0AAE0BT56_9CHLO|nr:hypothetical protein CYMTET_48804 [Cymbomonas tetramitiformis]
MITRSRKPLGDRTNASVDQRPSAKPSDDANGRTSVVAKDAGTERARHSPPLEEILPSVDDSGSPDSSISLRERAKSGPLASSGRPFAVAAQTLSTGEKSEADSETEAWTSEGELEETDEEAAQLLHEYFEYGLLPDFSKASLRLEYRGIRVVPCEDIQFGQELGEGAFSVVRCGSVRNGDDVLDVAVKTITVEKGALRKTLAGFEREAKMTTWAQGNEPGSNQSSRCQNGIVSLVGVAHEQTSDGVKLHMLLEQLSGGDLCTFINDERYCWQRISEKDAKGREHIYEDVDDHGLSNSHNPHRERVWGSDIKLALAQQLADFLCRLRSAELVHLDIKPANILLEKAFDKSRGGVVRLKLTDFGEARFADNVTSYARCVGTRGYMAPEIVDAALELPVSFPADVYAMGVTLLELFAGAVWQGGDAHKQDELDSEISEAMAKVHKADPCIAGIISRCLAPHPRDRPSATELQTLLKEASKTYSAIPRAHEEKRKSSTRLRALKATARDVFTPRGIQHKRCRDPASPAADASSEQEALDNLVKDLKF